MLRRLLIWIVLVALPAQGLASATMIRCGSPHAVPASAVVPDADPHGVAHGLDPHGVAHGLHAAHGGPHHADQGDGSGAVTAPFAHDADLAPGTDTAADRLHSQHSQDSQHSHHPGSASDRDAPCCAAALALPSLPLLVFPPLGHPAVIADIAGALPRVYLEGLRRPPRKLAA